MCPGSFRLQGRGKESAEPPKILDAEGIGKVCGIRGCPAVGRFVGSFSQAFRRTPVSIALMMVAGASFLGLFLLSGSRGGGGDVVSGLWFDSGDWAARPWTLLTYALVNPGPLALLCNLIGLYFFAMALESRWGSRRFGWAFAAVVASFSFAAWIGAMILGKPYVLNSMGPAVAAVVVAWGAVYPRTPVMLYAVLPIEGRWIAWGTGVLATVALSYGNPPMALFLALPFVLSALYGAGRLRLPEVGRRGKGKRSHDYEGLDWDRRREAEAERRRLKELFERSWRESDDEPGAKSS